MDKRRLFGRREAAQFHSLAITPHPHLEGIDAQYQEILQQAQSGGPEKLRTRENKLNRVEDEIERESEKIKKLINNLINLTHLI